MNLLTTLYQAATINFRKSLQARITQEMLFSMPTIATVPAIILGATRATPFIVADAVKAGHREFVVVGGKRVNHDDFIFTKFLVKKLEAAGLPRPKFEDMKEHEYAEQLLTGHFCVPPSSIQRVFYDSTRNFQENMEGLQDHGYDRAGAVEMYALAGSALRALGTARRVWNNDTIPIAVHNVYPNNVNARNWMDDSVSAFYATSEAEKILSFNGQSSQYKSKGYVVDVNIVQESEKVTRYINDSRPNGPAFRLE